MKKNNYTIWVDMSDLSIWSGHFTGIQRVVFNIASKLNNEIENVRFFCMDSNNSFYEYDFNSFLAKLKINDNNLVVTSVSAKSRLKHTIKRYYLKSPKMVRKLIPPQRAKRLALFGGKSYSNLKKIKNIIKNQIVKDEIRKAVIFNKGDTVLILGNSWDRPALTTKLNNQKNIIGFKLYHIIYDLIPTFQPQAFSEELFRVYTNNMFEVVSCADGLWAISESSKVDTLRFCEELCIKPPRIDVIHLGDNLPNTDNPKKPIAVKENLDFIICVGTIEARKNHTILYYAWKLGLSKGLNMPNLIIVGKQGWYTGDIIHTIQNDPAVMDKITIMNGISDDELVWLYKNCLFTIYPSYYEGWGLPVAESLAMGKVCISSNTSSMTEAGGEFADYFSPFDSRELLDKIIKYCDPGILVQKESTINNKYRATTWDECAQKIILTINR